ncbi:MAG: exodeoxyribonuclease VII small subunit [Gammaproteobacteria bacterium]|nr:exodeoxyribonuclease VII small subunit [Gammaproteobacteria bacterium]MYK47513.1 exodeoxyribonuclease VII small subunit [Gammaproteobacteria bacterium]
MADPASQARARSEEQDPIDFEAALAELEALVGRMETGSLSLEESLAAFERGIKLTRECQSALKSAELRIKALTQEGDELDLSGDDGDRS